MALGNGKQHIDITGVQVFAMPAGSALRRLQSNIIHVIWTIGINNWHVPNLVNYVGA